MLVQEVSKDTSHSRIFYKESIVLIKYITLLNTIKFFNYNTHFKKLSYVKTYLYYTELYIKN